MSNTSSTPTRRVILRVLFLTVGIIALGLVYDHAADLLMTTRHSDPSHSNAYIALLIATPVITQFLSHRFTRRRV